MGSKRFLVQTSVLLCLAGKPTAAPAEEDAVVEMKKGAAVHARPDGKSPKRGAVLKGARFRVEERKKGKGCKGEWLRIAPVAWVCSKQTRPTEEPPGGPRLPELEADELVPYPYLTGRNLTAYSSLDDAAAGSEGTDLPGNSGLVGGARVTRAGKKFVKTVLGYIAAEDLAPARPSDHGGVRIDAGTRLPLGFVVDGQLYDARGREADRRLPRRQVVQGLPAAETLPGGRLAHLVGDGLYVAADGLRVVKLAARPDDVAAGERWIDVSLDEQTLVVYDGDQPIFATLISTARSTPLGIQRIEAKRPHSLMQSTERYSEPNRYRFQVPWVMDLAGRYALHGAWWHDAFGEFQGHGCVNLAPRDAVVLWELSEPALPPGWAHVRALDEEGARGTVVRIRR